MMEIVAKFFATPEALREYLQSEKGKMLWEPSGICYHHTAEPSLAMRPKGLSLVHIRNLEAYYESLGWRRGPHFFVDDRGWWAFFPVSERGTHAILFNATHIGIEVLGDYDEESPTSGRGAECWDNAFLLGALLRDVFGSLTINIHREDPEARKVGKTCPGTKVSKEWIVSGVSAKKPGEIIDRSTRGWSVQVTPSETSRSVTGTESAGAVVVKLLDVATLCGIQNLRSGLKTEDKVLYYNGTAIPSARYDTLQKATFCTVRDAARAFGYSVTPDVKNKKVFLRKNP